MEVFIARQITVSLRTVVRKEEEQIGVINICACVGE